MQGCGRARCSRRSRLLRRLAGCTHVPALALSCPIQPVVPVAPCGAGEFGAVRQSSARPVVGDAVTPTPDIRSVATSAIDANGLGICPDIIPSTTTDLGNISPKLDRNASQLWADQSLIGSGPRL